MEACAGGGGGEAGARVVVAAGAAVEACAGVMDDAGGVWAGWVLNGAAVEVGGDVVSGEGRLANTC